MCYLRTLLLIAIVLAALVISTLGESTEAAPQASAALTPIDDAYTDSNSAEADNPHDRALLDLAFSGGTSPQPSKIVFLKFDLSSVGFAIQEARLNIAALSSGACGGSPDAVDIAIYKVTDDSWSEATLTWNNQPARADNTVLDTLDEGAVQGAGYHHWTDTGSDNLATWLELQRTGDKTASLRLEITGNPGTTEAFFEDDERTGAGAGCSESAGGPVLQLADFTGPLAVTLASFCATSNPGGQLGTDLLTTAFGLLAIVAFSGIVFGKRVFARY